MHVGLARQRDDGILVDDGVLERLARLGVLEVHRPAGERLQAANGGVRRRNPRVLLQLDRLPESAAEAERARDIAPGSPAARSVMRPTRNVLTAPMSAAAMRIAAKARAGS